MKKLDLQVLAIQEEFDNYHAEIQGQAFKLNDNDILRSRVLNLEERLQTLITKVDDNLFVDQKNSLAKPKVNPFEQNIFDQNAPPRMNP